MPTLPDSSPLASAFDGALRRVERLLVADAGTADSPAAPAIAPRLTRLRAELLAERAVALARGSADHEWVGRTVRDVATWAPEDEIALLAAFGAIARLSGTR